MSTAPSPSTVTSGRAGQAWALTMHACHRSYGAILALPPVTLQIPRGAVCTVVGPNGTGKTTLLRIAAGLARPSGGRCDSVRRALYVAPGHGARGSQTVAQAVGFAAALAGGDAEEAIELAGLTGLRASRVGKLSAGQRGRMTLAVALAADPALACLDEPDAHLDVEGKACAARVIDHLVGRGAAVLVATHDDRWLDGRSDGHLVLASAAERSS